MGLVQQNYFDSGSKKIMSPEYRMVAQLGEQLKKMNSLIMFVIMTAKHSSYGSAGQWFESIPYDSVTHTAK